MPDGIFVSGTISGIDFIYAGAIYMAGNATNWPFTPIFYVFKYKWKCWMLHSRCEMWDNFSSIVSGIDSIFSGAIYRTRNAKKIIYADLLCIQIQIAPDGNAR